MSNQENRKPLVTIAPSGAFLFWLSVFAMPCGIFLYSGPILFFGVIGLLILAITRSLSSRQLQQIKIVRRLPKRGFPGETFEIETEIENLRQSLTSREILMDDKLAGHSGSGVKVTSLAPGRTLLKTYPAKVFQRGRLQIPNYTLSSQWPFGFFKTTLQSRFESVKSGDDTMLIAPKPVIPNFIDRILQQLEQEAVLFSEFNPDDPTEFRSLRKFRSGDSVKSIHWPASSRSETIIVREFDPPLPKPQCHGIFLHQYVAPGEMNQPDRFEKILRIASGLLVHFWNRNLPVIVRMELPERQIFQVPGEHRYHEVLDALAEALSEPASTLDYLNEGWQVFENCDQVFVLGDSNRQLWQSKTEDKHPSIICIDPETGGFKKRKARVIKPAGKILTR